MKYLPLILLILSNFIFACSSNSSENTDGGTDTNNNEQLTVAITSPQSNAFIEKTIDVEVSYTGPAGELTLIIDSNNNYACNQPQNGSVTCSFDTSTITDGIHTIKVKATNANVPEESVESSQIEITVDNNAPVAKIYNEVFQKFTDQEDIYFLAKDDVGLKEISIYWNDESIITTDTWETLDYNGEKIGKFTWDTTKINDDIGALKVVATDKIGHTTDSTAVPIILLNKAEEITYTENALIVIDIPTNYESVEIDQKIHWNMPANVKQVIVAGLWDAQNATLPWDLEESIGTGYCPHSGEQKADVTGDNGLLIVRYDENDTALTEGQWFTHFRTNNPEDHVNEQLEVEIHGILIYNN